MRPIKYLIVDVSGPRYYKAAINAKEVDVASNNQNPGRGWHGDSKGHAKAGSLSTGKFKKNDRRTKVAAQAGGVASPGKFMPGSERAKAAGRKGGSK
ncbi:MAG TPA: hypothetical protein VJM46_03595 [Candidatus Saccharimonadales bacterium]|nr:hypothetical protein [Candidatus Saccharimonadales bacterium]